MQQGPARPTTCSLMTHIEEACFKPSSEQMVAGKYPENIPWLPERVCPMGPNSTLTGFYLLFASMVT